MIDKYKEYIWNEPWKRKIGDLERFVARMAIMPAKPRVLQNTREAIFVMHELGAELRRSFGPIENETLPPGMAMLQLALAEVMRAAMEEDCDISCSVSLRDSVIPAK